jgi:hypothetical protein
MCQSNQSWSIGTSIDASIETSIDASMISIAESMLKQWISERVSPRLEFVSLAHGVGRCKRNAPRRPDAQMIRSMISMIQECSNDAMPRCSNRCTNHRSSISQILHA